MIHLRKHKTNKSGQYSAKVECVCSCDAGTCSMHIIAKFLKMRGKAYETARKNPVLLGLDNRPLPLTHGNNLNENLDLKLNMDPTKHSYPFPKSRRSNRPAKTLKPPGLLKDGVDGDQIVGTNFM